MLQDMVRSLEMLFFLPKQEWDRVYHSIQKLCVYEVCCLLDEVLGKNMLKPQFEILRNFMSQSDFCSTRAQSPPL